MMSFPAIRDSLCCAASHLRVVVDAGASGAWNMGLDEALLDDPDGGWTLRLYRWDQPTVSLGYAQAYEHGFDKLVARRLGIPVVRRPTGGRAVLHSDELTYALTGPVDHGPLSGGISKSYRCIASGLQAGLRRLGADVQIDCSDSMKPPFSKGPCFGARTRYELSVCGRKVAGSAQRRREGRLLQHGSVLLGNPNCRLWAALGKGYSQAAESSIGLVEVLGHRPPARALAFNLSGALGEALQLTPRRGVLSCAEIRRARSREEKYCDIRWTLRR